MSVEYHQAAFTFQYPMYCATLICGGITTSMCIWFGQHSASMISTPFRSQLQEDIMNDQISLKEFVDPFTGEPVKQGR